MSAFFNQTSANTTIRWLSWWLCF